MDAFFLGGGGGGGGGGRLITMVPLLQKFPTSFSLSVKNFCFHLLSCANFQSLVTFNRVSESVDGLQIRVNLADPKIENSVVTVFESNSSNFWGMIFQKLKKFSEYHFPLKRYSNLKYLRILTDFRSFTNKMYRIYS